MTTGDTSVITSVAFPRIPYDAGRILADPQDPLVHPLLPAPLRRDFVRDRSPELLSSMREGPLNFVAIRVLESGAAFVGFGTALLLGVFLIERRSATGRGTRPSAVTGTARASALRPPRVLSRASAPPGVVRT